MRASVGCFACLAAMASVAFAAPESAPSGNSMPTYYLRGYYSIDSQTAVWRTSDAAPWSRVKENEPWVNRRIVSKWGYVPFTHDSKNYYCYIDDHPQTGSHVVDTTFICGDPDTLQWLFQNNSQPTIPLIGGGSPLQSSLRPKPSNGN